ncbi:uncharacterized protein N0V89_006668 [Didymosphaeria variabile]|uniref:Uncharacterized protein n=1 Tax=Didymosphaeria variabile TaxID=1932322 RepID=A0A9W8XI20_9PLEO|nr:uncharacterized protein N0V89_006668 [Didymosphaeria variabile]KAJ4351329.1 hypothetical protein N0V89_006668 [Didymosphaeria variabile]
MQLRSTVTVLLLGALSHALAHAAPAPALPPTPDLTPAAKAPNIYLTPAAKAPNIYLTTCIPKPRGTDGKPAPVANFTAIAYFRQPLNMTTVDADTKAPKPDKAALVAQPAEPWEGVRWKVKVWNEKLFSASIVADAAKGALAGEGQLGEEEYVCFRDGETGIRMREDGVRGIALRIIGALGWRVGRG